MRALVCHRIGEDLSGLTVSRVDKPVPTADQVLVEVHYCGINFPDILSCQGRYQHRSDPPFIPGMEVVGRVVSTGPAAQRFEIGDWVVATMKRGGIAEYALAEEGACMPKPRHLSLPACAAYSTTYLTAYVSLVRRAQLQPSETVLVHGASGGVGLACIDLAKRLDADVIATTGSEIHRDALEGFGVERILDANGFAADVNRLTEAEGANVIVDPVGGRVFEESTHCIAFDGRLLVVGFTSGRFAELKTNIALIKGFSVLGVRAGEYGRRFPRKGRENQMAVWKMADEGVIRPQPNTILPMSDAIRALQCLMDRAVFGKVVVEVRS